MAPALAWIHSSKDNHQYNAADRKVIRTQAMKAAAAARKKSPTWGKKNTRQPIINRHATSQRARDAWPAHGKHTISITQYVNSDWAPTEICPDSLEYAALDYYYPPPPMPLAGFERLAVDVGVNVLDLDELTAVAAGQVATKLLFQDGTRLNALVTRRRGSYLLHIPSRYGTNPCLDDALRYMAAKARSVLSPNSSPPPTSHLHLYGKALQSLQAAVDDDDSRNDPSVLCAIEILSISELFQASGEHSAWENHIYGAGQMIRARGPSRFTTEFEKSLLASMISPLVCESLRRLEPCFLEDPAWEQTILSLAIPGQHEFAPRGVSYLKLWVSGTRLPRLLSELGEVVKNPENYSEAELDDLEFRCRQFQDYLAEWREDYNDLVANASSPKPASSALADVRIELLGAGLVMQATACRMVGALSPWDRIEQESAALTLAKQTRVLVHNLSYENRHAAFYLQQKIFAATSILASTDVWLEGCEVGRTENLARPIEKYKYDTWTNNRPTTRSPLGTVAVTARDTTYPINFKTLALKQGDSPL
ncbi:hypothetical protein BX600DRAFT_447467 [Xylariales sp. PMI_506]|nr:hypothetical protein BX600DRAFT_447467 [Xylariales sp. PMI_506]